MASALSEGRVPTGIEGFDGLIEGGIPRRGLILLAGDAGSGKTIFAAQYLYHGISKLKEPGIYVSFAENRQTFLENMSRINIDFEKYEQEGTFRFLDLITVTDKGVGVVLEKILAEIDSLKAKRLVVDSFTALAQAFSEQIDVRITVHTILGKMVRQSGCTTILVAEKRRGDERIGSGMEEFVADGVILLKDTILDGRPFRELEIRKLRGTRLTERNLAFTLGGGFRVFPPFKPKPIDNPSVFEPTPDPPEGFSTGIPDLDRVIGGGVPRGSSILLDLSEKISSAEEQMFAAAVVANWVAQGRGAWILPSSYADYEVIRSTALRYGFSQEAFENLVLVSGYRKERAFEKRRPNFIPLGGSSLEEDFQSHVKPIGDLAGRTGKPMLLVLSADVVGILYGEDQCERFLDMGVSMIRQRDSLAIYSVSRRRKKLGARLSALCETHLSLVKKHGAILFYGTKPRTGIYAVEADVSNGCAMPRLAQIV